MKFKVQSCIEKLSSYMYACIQENYLHIPVSCSRSSATNNFEVLVISQTEQSCDVYMYDSKFTCKFKLKVKMDRQ